ncbi:VRR-NUC domain-containing protein [Castellaniella sp. FW104-16D08]|uniref:VRR-NUC domain-containing protein n=1 Tax=unclassified Castellaniella TaxID=2617606 RepID=UPI0033163B76
MRESDIEKYLVKRVNELGGEVRKVKWIGRRGAPDRLVMLPPYRLPSQPQNGRVTTPEIQQAMAAVLEGRKAATVWIELKAPGGKAKPHQAREHERMRRMGQCVVVVDSMEGVDEVLA